MHVNVHRASTGGSTPLLADGPGRLDVLDATAEDYASRLPVVGHGDFDVAITPDPPLNVKLAIHHDDAGIASEMDSGAGLRGGHMNAFLGVGAIGETCCIGSSTEPTCFYYNINFIVFQ